MTYIILPKPGYSVADLMMEGFNIRNARIVKRVGSIIVEEHPYTEYNFRRYNPLPPPGYSSKELLFVGERGYALGKHYLGEYLYGGWNPYKQAIALSVEEMKEMTEDEILDVIFLDLKWLKRTDKNEQIIKKLIEAMSKAGYLNYRMGVYWRGDRKLPLEDTVIPLRRGVEPIVMEIWDFISMKDNKTASFREVYTHMVKDLNWIQTDEVFGEAKHQVRGYLKNMIRKGYLKEVEQDMFTTFKSPEVIR